MCLRLSNKNEHERINVKGKLLAIIALPILYVLPQLGAAYCDDTPASDGKSLFADIAKMEEALDVALVDSKTETLNTLFASDFVFYSDVEGLVKRSEVLGRAKLDARSLGAYDRMRYRSTLTVLPLPGFGALAVGSHNFADRASETQNFIHIWAKQDEYWRLTRAIGYGLGSDNLDPNTAKKVRELDTALFEAFNHRNSEAMRPFYATDVEFFHDQVGRTLGQDAVIATFRNKFEGDFVERHQLVQRELIDNSLHLFPIPGYGVLEVGNHRFTISSRETKRVTAITVGAFVHVIKNLNHAMRIELALSYDHTTTTMDR
jgi:hypothetical protein